MDALGDSASATNIKTRTLPLPQNHYVSSSISTSNPPHISDTDGDSVARLSAILRSNGVDDFSFKRVPSDYYDWPLESRRDVLGAASIDHLCKSIVLVNTQAHSNVIDCSDSKNSKYYVVVVQVMMIIIDYTVRLAPEEASSELTGFVHNAVTCIGMKTDIPVILDEAIVKLTPDFFWLGGGEVYLKLGIRTYQLIRFVKPFIVKYSNN